MSTERARRLLREDWTWAVAVGLILALIGLIRPSSYAVSVAVSVMVYMILAVGLNVVLGFTGLLDLGYAAFVAVGAFTLALGLVLTDQPERPFDALPLSQVRLDAEQMRLTPQPGLPIVVRERPDLAFDVVEGAESVLAARAAGEKTIAARHVTGLTLPVGQRTARGTHPLHFPGSFFLLVLLAGTVCAGAALLRGYPTLRLVGDYYAIVTLGFAEIVGLLCRNWDWLTGGAFGIKLSRDTLPSVLWADPYLYDETPQYYFILLAALALTVLLVGNLQRSRIGRTWAAIKADETAAMSSGIDVARAKLTAFAVSGFVGGVGGALYAIKLSTVKFDAFDIWLSIQIVCCVVLGGMGTIRGALIGAAIVGGLGELLRYLSDSAVMGDYAFPIAARNLVYGLILVLLMRFRPQGILPPRAAGGAPDQAGLASLRAASTPLFHLVGPQVPAPQADAGDAAPAGGTT